MSDTRSQARRRRFSVDALFADTSTRATGVSEMVDAKVILLERIEPDPEQPRKEFNPETLEELAASIRSEGVLQPIAVRYHEERDIYVIVHGERRWRAAGIAALEAIPAIVRDVPEERRLLQQLVENIVREDLNALDRAAALRALKVQMADAPWEQVAEAVGIRRSRLFQLLSTEKLAEPVQEALRRGLVSEKQTRAAHQLPEEVQVELGQQILDGALDPREIEQHAKAHRAGKPATPSDTPNTSRTVATARKQARNLRATLDQLATASLDTVDLDAAESLADELDELSKRLTDVRARL
jgi:ParB family chromosome partitioning protein